MKVKTIKTLADFKKAIELGIKVHCTRHNVFAGRDEKNNILYKDEDLGIREISIKQTNAFALKTTRSDNTVVDSWCHYPKASNVKIENNKVVMLEVDLRDGQGGIVRTDSPEYKNCPMMPILTYTVFEE